MKGTFLSHRTGESRAGWDSDTIRVVIQHQVPGLSMSPLGVLSTGFILRVFTSRFQQSGGQKKSCADWRRRIVLWSKQTWCSVGKKLGGGGELILESEQQCLPQMATLVICQSMFTASKIFQSNSFHCRRLGKQRVSKKPPIGPYHIAWPLLTFWFICFKTLNNTT